MVESEKLLEAKLGKEIKKLGGWSIKLLPFIINGLPDRVVLLPRGRMFFAEIKTTGESPDPIQKVIHRKLRKLGFRVEIIDTSEQIKALIKEYEGNRST